MQKRLLLSVLALWASGWIFGVHAQEYPQMTLRFGHTFSATTIQSQLDQWFADEIEKRSGGKIKIRIYWSEMLGKNTEMLDLVGSGAIELGTIVPAFFPTRMPLSGITNALPLAFDSAKQAQIIQNELVEKFPEVQEEYRRNNVWPILNHGLGIFRLLCVKPVATLDDLKSLRIRSYGEYVPKLWAAVGAVGVTTLPPEVYEGLQRGKLDCAYFATDLSYSFKLYEVAKYWSTANFGALSTWPILVNYDLWHNKWPANVRKLFEEVARDTVNRDREMVDAAEKKSLTEMQKLGNVQIVQFKDQEKLDKMGPDFSAAWIANMKQNGKGDIATRIIDYWQKRRAELKELH